jgi:hypothetical protein
MAHIKNSKTKAERTGGEWLPIGAELGKLVNTWAARDDLVAYVGPGAGGPAPACYNPAMAEVEVNVDVAFGVGVSPDTIGDITVRKTQFAWPKATGAIFHEALHARFSRFDLVAAAETLSKKENEALHLLEETRIESAGARVHPGNVPFLRACALQIVLSDTPEDIATSLTTKRLAARLAGLTLARVDAGVLKEVDVAPIREVIERILGDELLAELRSIWLQFQEHDEHYNAGPLYPLAREWSRLVEEAAKDDEGEGGESGKGGITEGMRELLDALKDAAEDAAMGAQEDIDGQEQSEDWAREADARGSSSRERAKHKEEGNKVFNKGSGPGSSRTNSRLLASRQADSSERRAAVTVATMLEKAKYRERDIHEISSVTPPGRLRTRALVQGAALKSKGLMTQTEPWRRNVRKHTDEPTLTIGVMVDISGSMSSAMEPMAVTAWVMSEAAKRVQARTAMVYYGQDVFPTLKPGQHLDKVHVYTAPDGTEKFDKAFKALDGGLNLLYGAGARLLVVVSDGHYTYDESRAAASWMKRCQEAGVAVLWLPFDSGSGARGICKSNTDAVIIGEDLNPAQAATKIGQAAAKALTAMGNRAA